MPSTLATLCAAADLRLALTARLWALLPRAHGGSGEAAAECARVLEALGWMRGLDEAGRARVAEAWGLAGGR